MVRYQPTFWENEGKGKETGSKSKSCCPFLFTVAPEGLELSVDDMRGALSVVFSACQGASQLDYRPPVVCKQVGRNPSCITLEEFMLIPQHAGDKSGVLVVQRSEASPWCNELSYL